MVALRLLSLIIFVALVTGCADYKEREFLRKALNVQQDCSPPGNPSNVECHYKLTVTKISGNKARGRLPMEAIQPNQDGCKKLIEEKDFPPHYICPSSQDYPEHEYAFEVDPATPVEINHTYHFINNLRSKSLRVFKD